MRSSDPPGLADATATPIEALRAAITNEYPSLLKTTQMMASKARLAARGESVTALAEDILSEAVTRAMSRADRWSPDTLARPWIAAFVAHIILERQRALGSDRQRFQQTAASADEHAETSILDRLIDPNSLTQDHLFELLDQVSEPDRTLLRLAYVEREPQVDIARRLGITDGALRVRLTRARQRFVREHRDADQGGRP